MSERSTSSSDRIVVGIDGSPAGQAAIRWAVDHARAGDEVTLVHAWEPSPTMAEVGPTQADEDQGARAFARREVERARLLAADRGIEVGCEVIRGDPRQVLCSVPADLVVVGAHGHHVVVGLLLGSVSTHLAAHCAAPLVIVRCPTGNHAAS